MFRVSTTPIISSTQNCNYSLRYWSYFLCSYLPPTWSNSLAWPRCKEVAAIPEAVVTVLCTPDDGCGWHPKQVEWTCRIIAWPRCKEVAAVPEAEVTVLCTPDDGCGWHPKQVEWNCRIIAWSRSKEVAAVPEAVVTVLCTPDDGCGWHPKHVQWTCRIINRLLCVASCWTVIDIDQCCTES